MIARVASAAAVIAVVALGISVVRYEGARDAWRARAGIDAEGYDAAASDAAYAAVAGALVWVERAARGCAAMIVIAGAAIGRAAERRKRTEVARSRRLAARGIDVAVLAVALVLTRLRVGSPGITEALAWSLPSVALSVALAFALTGATIGDRIVGAHSE